MARDSTGRTSPSGKATKTTNKRLNVLDSPPYPLLVRNTFPVRGLSLLLLALATACGSSSGDPSTSTDDSGSSDDSATVPVDSSTPGDSAPADSGTLDSGSVDSSTVDDSAVSDTTPADSSATDTSTTDSITTDTASVDSASADTADAPTRDSAADTAVADTAVTDTAVVDTAVVDTRLDVVDTADTSTTCTSAADAGAACNTLVNGASAVSIVQVTTPIPTGTGGTVYDGLYYLTDFTAYAGSGLTPRAFGRQTLMVCGLTATFVNDEVGKSTVRKNFAFAPVGNVPNITETCASGGGTPIPYSSYTATTRAVTFYSTVYGFSVTYTMP